MESFELERDQVLAGLRAMRVVAGANGVFSEEEREVIRAVAQVFEVSVDVDSLEPITPDELAKTIITRPHHRSTLMPKEWTAYNGLA